MILAVSVACSGEQAREVSTSGTRSGSASPSGILVFEGEGVALAPGRYAYDSFIGPRISFAVGSGWIGGHVQPEFFDVQREAGGVLLGFADPNFIASGDGPVEVDELAAEDAVSSIASIRPFEAGAVRPTAIDGRRAFEVHGSPRTNVELFGGNEGSFTVEPGLVRLLAVDVEEALMLIVVSVFEDQRAGVEHAIDGVIASVRFEGTA